MHNNHRNISRYTLKLARLFKLALGHCESSAQLTVCKRSAFRANTELNPRTPEALRSNMPYFQTEHYSARRNYYIIYSKNNT
eukprot:4834542-Amphidinium_carterae.1